MLASARPGLRRSSASPPDPLSLPPPVTSPAFQPLSPKTLAAVPALGSTKASSVSDAARGAWSNFRRKLSGVVSALDESVTNSVGPGGGRGGGRGAAGAGGTSAGGGHKLVTTRNGDSLQLRFVRAGPGEGDANGVRAEGEGTLRGHQGSGADGRDDAASIRGAKARDIAADVARRMRREGRRLAKGGGTGTAGASGTNWTESRRDGDEDDPGLDDMGHSLKVDCLVVDNGLDSSEQWKAKLEGGGGETLGSVAMDAAARHASHGNTSRRGSADDHPAAYGHVVHRSGITGSVRDFFDLGFNNSAKDEAAYGLDSWSAAKSIAIFGSLFYIVIWVLIMAWTPRPFSLTEMIVYYGLAPALNLTLPFLVIYDGPQRFKKYYQVHLCLTTWIIPLAILVDMRVCGYYRSHPRCGAKDFTGLAYAYSAIPTVTMLAMNGSRAGHLISSFIFTVLLAALAAPESDTWIRNVVNFATFSIFLIIIAFLKEKAERRVFLLRYELKKQYRFTQKAQARESEEASSKKRFTSYIFHEVRVPLNTALLAVQNLESAGVFENLVDNGVEVHALTASLVQVQQVLNDILDFNRMNDGRFETVSKPFNLHRSIRSMMGAVSVMSGAKDIEFTSELDPEIDAVITAACAKAGTATMLSEDGVEEGIVFGDEMRLRQLISNLTSNATKFTPPGGSIIFRTKLIYPTPLATKETDESGMSVLALQLKELQSQGRKPIADKVVVRFEVEDTGPGIDAADLRDSRLFSPYVQTEIGRSQGGKGTGLGLALVRHIVRLSRGRLGVISKKGAGSTFWIELALLLPMPSSGAVFRRETDATVFDPTDPAFKAYGFPASEVETDHSMSPFRPVLMSDDSVTSPAPSHLAGAGPGGWLSTAATTPLRPALGPSIPSNSTSSYYTSEAYLLPSHKHAQTTSAASVDSPSSATFKIMPPPHEASDRAIAPPLPSSRQSANGSLTKVVTTSSIDHLDTTPIALPPNVRKATASDLSTPRLSPAPSQRVPTPTLSSPPLSPDALTPTSSLVAPTRPDPAPHTRSKPSSTSSAASLQPPIPQLKILLVDDDKLTRKLMGRMLSKMGHSCSEAEDGQVACDMLGVVSRKRGAVTPAEDSSEEQLIPPHGPYDIVYLDNNMPRKSGVEVVQALRRMERSDLVVGCTGNAMKEDQDEYREAGVDELLTKPIMQADLYRTTVMAHRRRTGRERESSASTIMPSSSALPSPTSPPPAQP